MSDYVGRLSKYRLLNLKKGTLYNDKTGLLGKASYQ